ncbi:MAG: SUMF1/EgtB/PvdO family nonheme iron enzyme [Desulfobacterales bacterium]|uniref:SUMF1/EgtB/PvdO family nonheme iron enzyme n=1 Tax=Candidatus Desulfatibia profunda TaxID=2841695 RepID=A0A8J6NMQ0_9BACT|nr:SUMF1/EgtB/PvdO family nonheme iron enzyme [Candidatus Desulfatibia profunda]MBL7180566.1 SUMF1/EgtB/PvdO family nonheme iron enzyme [Desulfobacterales bacterium]
MGLFITLNGIDQAVSGLNYNNRNTLKHKMIHLIRQAYPDDSSVESLEGINPDELIKALWDTDDDSESIRNRRKNFNCIKSSVNADLRKLYKEGKNPEGIIIGPDNTFMMSAEAKDSVLEKIGFDIKSNGTVSLDQIMDILKMIHETLSGSMEVEETEGIGGLSQLDQLKDLLQGLSKLTGSAEKELKQTVSETSRMKSDAAATGNIRFKDDIESLDKIEVADDNAETGIGQKGAGRDLQGKDSGKGDAVAGDDGEAGVKKTSGHFDDAGLQENFEVEDPEDVERVEDPEEDNVLDEVTEVELDETAEDSEDVEEVEDLEEEDVLDEVVEVAPDEVAEDVEEAEDLEEDAVLDEVGEAEPDKAVEDSENPEETGAAGSGEAPAGGMIEKNLEALGSEDDVGRAGAGGDVAGPGFQGKASGENDAAVGDDGKAGAEETSGHFDEAGLQEDLKIDAPEDVEEVEDLEEDEVLDEVVEVAPDEVAEDVEEAEDLEEDAVLDEVEEVEPEEAAVEADLDESYEADDNELEGGEPSDDFEEIETAQDPADLGLPVDSLGQEHSDEVSDEIQKAKLLAESFDGYLGAMDRYYNQYVFIPKGEYIIGGRNGKKADRPEQKVFLSSFYIGRFPITNALFEIFVEKTGYITHAEKVGYGTVYYGRFQKIKNERTGLITSTWNSCLHCETVQGAYWYQPSGAGSTLHNKRAHPVVQIALEDSMAFAAWTGKRIPTENEWEAASGAAKSLMYPWGPDWKDNACNIENSCAGDTTPVDQYVEFENDFGIVDTMGNVLEWTSDSIETLSDKGEKYRYHIAKGGSWISGKDIRLFSRFELEPESHSNILGFRCVAH